MDFCSTRLCERCSVTTCKNISRTPKPGTLYKSLPSHPFAFPSHHTILFVKPTRQVAISPTAKHRPTANRSPAISRAAKPLKISTTVFTMTQPTALPVSLSCELAAADFHFRTLRSEVQRCTCSCGCQARIYNGTEKICIDCVKSGHLGAVDEEGDSD